ncbi:hypothetical protein DVS28_b0607 (plasmid) [Euzebya pacifica]|uniref:Uncharacterized protein n=1 Tax=Euzebya pacifica TaxID=1608957 RepID=A0A346Y7A0_9ACTN|nr:hypothetical protein [Euzebya pacifica]AXV10347.1 hypothetical protein DVS28_b0607 [Euzebya pacifica]
MTTQHTMRPSGGLRGAVPAALGGGHRHLEGPVGPSSIVAVIGTGRPPGRDRSGEAHMAGSVALLADGPSVRGVARLACDGRRTCACVRSVRSLHAHLRALGCRDGVWLVDHALVGSAVVAGLPLPPTGGVLYELAVAGRVAVDCTVADGHLLWQSQGPVNDRRRPVARPVVACHESVLLRAPEPVRRTVAPVGEGVTCGGCLAAVAAVASASPDLVVRLVDGGRCRPLPVDPIGLLAAVVSGG